MRRLQVRKLNFWKTQKGRVKMIAMDMIPEYPRERMARRKRKEAVGRLWEPK